MDRLAVAYAWNDPQARDQAVLVATAQEIDWDALLDWFRNEGESEKEYALFREAVSKKETSR